MPFRLDAQLRVVIGISTFEYVNPHYFYFIYVALQKEQGEHMDSVDDISNFSRNTLPFLTPFYPEWKGGSCWAVGAKLDSGNQEDFSPAETSRNVLEAFKQSRIFWKFHAKRVLVRS